MVSSCVISSGGPIAVQRIIDELQRLSEVRNNLLREVVLQFQMLKRCEPMQRAGSGLNANGTGQDVRDVIMSHACLVVEILHAAEEQMRNDLLSQRVSSCQNRSKLLRALCIAGELDGVG